MNHHDSQNHIMTLGGGEELHAVRLISHLWCAMAVGVLLSGVLCAQDRNSALLELIDVLAKNGQITAEQAVALKKAAQSPERAPGVQTAVAPAKPVEAKSTEAPRVVVVPKENGITRLALSGKIHSQWDWISTKASSGPNPEARNNFLIRRLELAVNADIGKDWTGNFTADFAASNVVNTAYIAYNGIPGEVIMLGHTKVPFVWEEETSDSVIKGVERSYSHRVIVEHPTRGIGSKNAGIHLRSTAKEGLVLWASITNPGAKNSAGQAGNISNGLAYWARIGWVNKLGDGLLNVGIDGAYLPDYQPAGPLDAYAVHAHFTGPVFDFLTEVVRASYPRQGLSDSQLVGFMVEPTLKLSKTWELVLRYSSIDSDGIGVSPSVPIRSAPGTGEFDRFDGYYIGGNCYFAGNAMRLTFGYDHANAKGRITGPANRNRLDGLHYRFQFLF